MTTQNTGIIATLPAGFGAWDLTVHPYGGDFVRPSVDIVLFNVREYPTKPGYYVGECDYPNRKGKRTICSDKFTNIQSTHKLVLEIS